MLHVSGSYKTPIPTPASRQPVWTAAGCFRPLKGPQSDGEMGKVGVTEGWRGGRGGHCLVAQLNAVERAEVKSGYDV